MHNKIIYACMCFSLLLCVCSDNPSGSSTPTRNAFRQYPYTSTTTTIQIIEDSTFCVGGSLSCIYDTGHATYTITNNTLTIASFDTLGSGAVIQHDQRYARIGTGTGLPGQWNMTSMTSTIAFGAPTAAELEKLDNDTTFINHMTNAGDVNIEVTGDTVFYIYVGSTADLILRIYNEMLAENENAKYFAVTTAKAGDAAITITGNITKEVVTVSADEKFNQTVSSTNPAHETYINYIRIEECPVDPPLTWFVEFVTSNISYAQVFIDIVQGAGILDSVDAEMVKVNDTIVTITGAISHEVITVTIHSDSTIVYTSSDPIHTAYETTLDAFQMPSWIFIFIMENARQTKRGTVIERR